MAPVLPLSWVWIRIWALGGVKSSFAAERCVCGEAGLSDAAESPWTLDQRGVSGFISVLLKACSRADGGGGGGLGEGGGGGGRPADVIRCCSGVCAAGGCTLARERLQGGAAMVSAGSGGGGEASTSGSMGSGWTRLVS